MTVFGVPVDPGQALIIAVMAVAAVVCAATLWITAGPDDEPWPVRDVRSHDEHVGQIVSDRIQPHSPPSGCPRHRGGSGPTQLHTHSRNALNARITPQEGTRADS